MVDNFSLPLFGECQASLNAGLEKHLIYKEISCHVFILSGIFSIDVF